MKKQDYQTPAMRVVKMRHKCQLLAGSNTKSNVRLHRYDGDDDYDGDIR